MTTQPVVLDQLDAMPDHKAAERLRLLASWLDDRFVIPGTNIRFGLDGVVGLIPGVGDTATTLVSAYIIAECWRQGVPKRTLVRMLYNLGLDWAVGLVPVVGDLFDIGFKANRRNVRLAQEALAEATRRRRAEGAVRA